MTWYNVVVSKGEQPFLELTLQAESAEAAERRVRDDLAKICGIEDRGLDVIVFEPKVQP